MQWCNFNTKCVNWHRFCQRACWHKSEAYLWEVPWCWFNTTLRSDTDIDVGFTLIPRQSQQKRSPAAATSRLNNAGALRPLQLRLLLWVYTAVNFHLLPPSGIWMNFFLFPDYCLPVLFKLFTCYTTFDNISSSIGIVAIDIHIAKHSIWKKWICSSALAHVAAKTL